MLTGLQKPQEREHDYATESPQPGQDESEVMAHGGEDDVGGIALAALET